MGRLVVCGNIGLCLIGETAAAPGVVRGFDPSAQSFG